MPFKKGDKRPEGAGWKPGSVSKKSTILAQIFEAAEFCPAEEVIRVLREQKDELLPKEYADICLRLMKFKFPEKKAVEHSGEVKGGVLGEILGGASGIDSSPKG